VLDPAKIPDELAYTALFMVIQPSPPPHWDYPARLNWLAKKGIDVHYAQKLIRIAGQYPVIQDYTAGQSPAFDANGHGPVSPAQTPRSRIAEARTAAMRDAIKVLRKEMDTPAAANSLARLIQEIKHNMQVRVD
jgi:hypothetical protein